MSAMLRIYKRFWQVNWAEQWQYRANLMMYLLYGLVSPVVYLNRFRVNRARGLLESSDETVTEVALAVGFASSGYFSTVFRREVGVTPAAYRRERA